MGVAGPAPFFWLTVPRDGSGYVRTEAADASYGWGAVPVHARIGATEWETSLLPKDGGREANGTGPAR